MFRFVILMQVLLVLIACDKNEKVVPNQQTRLEGTGSFLFKSESLANSALVKVFYHIPEDALTEIPVLMVFHGNSRDAIESRDALIEQSNRLKFIVLVPEFSDEEFPGSDKYNLGNIFTDGDRPSPQTLNPEEEWTFSVIDPIFFKFKELTNISTDRYDIFGHSAGAQVAHRFVFFLPDAQFSKVVASAAGWYTMPDEKVTFPYGIKDSPAENTPLLSLFTVPLTIIVGTNDNNPNAPSLRRNDKADVQGTNRLARAQYFFQESAKIAQANQSVHNWQYRTVNNAGHDFDANSSFAVNLLY